MNSQTYEQLLNMQELFSKRYNKDFSIEEVEQHCIAIVHDGIVNKNWSLNGTKAQEITN